MQYLYYWCNTSYNFLKHKWTAAIISNEWFTQNSPTGTDHYIHWKTNNNQSQLVNIHTSQPGKHTHTHRVTEWTSQDLQLWKQNYYCANIKKTNYCNILSIILRTKSRKGHCWLDLAGARQQMQQIPHMFSAGLRTGKFYSGHPHYLTFTDTLCKTRLTYGLNISLCHRHRSLWCSKCQMAGSL